MRLSGGQLMPILHIKALPQKDSSIIPNVLKKVSLAISEVYGCAPEHVSITWQQLDSNHYVVGDSLLSLQPLHTHPPICELICFEGKTPDQIEDVLKVASATLGHELKIPNNIFITYREASSGKVISGNTIVK